MAEAEVTERGVPAPVAPRRMERKQRMITEAIPETERIVVGAMGWIRDSPDLRDYTPQQQEVVKVLRAAGVADQPPGLRPSMDLRQWCSPIENQLNLGSCTAHAGVGLYEYFERRAFGRHIDGSRLFLYKATRDMLNWTGDTGAYLRTTMGAMALFGIPPEEHWPYNLSAFDNDPPTFVWQYAEHFEALSYYRLDPPGTTAEALLARIKANLAAYLPSMFGFTVYSSISQASTSGLIPFPSPGERVLGGHAVDVVGYDDNKKIPNTSPGGIETTGALLIRNSWGTGWGDGGYGYLPYEYVLKGAAVDFWSLVRGEFVELSAFRLD